MSMVPEAPDVAVPVSTATEPLLIPSDDDNTSFPLSPATDFPVSTDTFPPAIGPEPAESVTDPPVFPSALAAKISIFPPEYPDPDVTIASPPATLSDFGDLT